MMAIEPLLALLRRRVQGGVGLELGFKDPIMVSAYADDVSVVVKNEQDLQAVVGTLQTYQRASSVKVNWGRQSPCWVCVGSGGSQRSHSCQRVYSGAGRG